MCLISVVTPKYIKNSYKLIWKKKTTKTIWLKNGLNCYWQKYVEIKQLIPNKPMGPKKKSQGNLENILRWMKTYQNLWDAVNTRMLRGKYKVVNAFIKKLII